MKQLPADILARSAELCNAYNQMNALIPQLEHDIAFIKKHRMIDPQQAATRAAKLHIASNRPFKFSHMLIAVAAAMIPCAIFGGIGVWLGSKLPFLLALAAAICTFVPVYRRLHKKYEDQVYARYRAKQVEKYTLQLQRDQARLDNLTQQLQRLIAKRNKLILLMQDGSQCCIPAQYWAIGPQLCRMVQTGQAGNTQQAIALYHAPKQHPPIHTPSNTAADDARWNQLQAMMDRDLSDELDQKRTAQFLDAVEDLLWLELLDS